MILSIGAGLLKPWPLAVVVDSVLEQKPLPAFLQWAANWDKLHLIVLLAAAIFLLHVGQGACTALQNFISIRIGLRGLARVRNRVFAHLQRLSLRFHLGSNQGDMIYRASWDTYAFQTVFQQGCFTLAQASVTLILMLGVMWQVNWRLTLVTAAMTPLLLATMRSFGRQIRSRSLQAHQADSRLTSLVQQSIAAMPVIQAYTREEFQARQFAGHAAASLEKRTRQHGWEVAYWFAVALLFGLAAAVITGYGSAETLAGRLSVGELLVFIAYLTQLYEPLNQLSHVGATISEAGAGAQRVFELLDNADDVKESPSARAVLIMTEQSRKDAAPDAVITIQSEIRFDGVSFAYSPGRPVLNEVTFTLPAGKSAALIGPSGAGKTTLLQLIPRFYDPTGGSVKIGGIDVRELRLNDLRRQIAFVMQEPMLLPGTVRENIAYGRPDATIQEIEAAAQAAFADRFIRALPHGFDTLIGEGGARLSAGESQRINLARAFLKDAPILLLDEPTSALDAESQQLVMSGLRELMRRRTTLIVAHRLATIRAVNFVFVLDSGKLVQSQKAPGDVMPQME